MTNAQDHPDLVEEIQPRDSEEAYIERRTVVVSGEKIMFPDPRSLTGWDENLRTIPNITNAHCLLYLMLKSGWSANRVGALEKERGYQLFLEKHIHNVRMKKMHYDISCIRASCIRQTCQNEAPYDIWLFVSSSGNINSSQLFPFSLLSTPQLHQ